MKRFYKDVAVTPQEGGFAILLDGRTVKTPARNILVLPTEKLASAIAAEWREQGEEVVGNRTRVKVVKNKIAAPFRQAEFDIMYNQGISKAGDIIDLATAQGIVEKSGAWFAYKGTKIAQGREAAKEYLEKNPKVMDEVAKKVTEAAAKEE